MFRLQQGKKGKSGKQKKGPGSLMDIPQSDVPAEEAALEPYQETEVIMNNLLLVESYSRNVGRYANANPQFGFPDYTKPVRNAAMCGSWFHQIILAFPILPIFQYCLTCKHSFRQYSQNKPIQ